jgi:hypothetical protein
VKLLVAALCMMTLTGCAGANQSKSLEIKGPVVDSPVTRVAPPVSDEDINDIKSDIHALRYKLDNKSYAR